MNKSNAKKENKESDKTLGMERKGVEDEMPVACFSKTSRSSK